MVVVRAAKPGTGDGVQYRRWRGTIKPHWLKRAPNVEQEPVGRGLRKSLPQYREHRHYLRKFVTRENRGNICQHHSDSCAGHDRKEVVPPSSERAACARNSTRLGLRHDENVAVGRLGDALGHSPEPRLSRHRGVPADHDQVGMSRQGVTDQRMRGVPILSDSPDAARGIRTVDKFIEFPPGRIDRLPPRCVEFTGLG